MDLCYMSGYGVEINDLLPLLNEKTLKKWEEDENIISLFSELTDKDEYISWFSSDDGQFLYIRDRSPYDALFTGIDHINEYFYNKLKQYIKEDVTIKDLSEVLDDVFSYELS